MAAVLTLTDEYTYSVSPKRIFQGSIIDGNSLIPKLLPQVFKSMEFVQGTGGPGSIKQVEFAPGSDMATLKYRIDELDEANYSYSYTVIEGNALADKIEKITHEVKLQEAPNGGTIAKVASKYYTKPGFTLKEEDLKAGKEKAVGVYKAVEAYLLQNSNVYA